MFRIFCCISNCESFFLSNKFWRVWWEKKSWLKIGERRKQDRYRVHQLSNCFSLSNKSTSGRLSIIVVLILNLVHRLLWQVHLVAFVDPVAEHVNLRRKMINQRTEWCLANAAVETTDFFGEVPEGKKGNLEVSSKW